MGNIRNHIAHYHLPGLFEFYELYRAFLPLWKEHQEYFYDWCDIGSIYGAPADCIWGGGRVGFGDNDPQEVLALMQEHGISARLTFSNSLLCAEHLSDRKCNALSAAFETAGGNGVIVHSDLLLDYLKKNYPGLYFVSSTTKVLTDFRDFENELSRDEFRYVVPDFRLNKVFEKLNSLTQVQKDKVEFLCNECCWFDCHDRKTCYENVSRKCLGENCSDHICVAPDGSEGYRFSKAMTNPGFIGIDDIVNGNWTIAAIQNQRKPIVIQGNRPKKDIDQATSIVFIVAAAPFQCIQKRLNLRSCKSNLLARLYGKLPVSGRKFVVFFIPHPGLYAIFLRHII